MSNYVDAKSGITFIHVPAGEFLYRAYWRKVVLPDYWIGRTPVTNGQYARFVADNGRKPPSHWQGSVPPAALVDHPVTHVSWLDAEAYAKWAEAELPSEEAWEKAARGTEWRLYPWGNGWQPSMCNAHEAGFGTTTPVGMFSPAGDSPYGCVDMSGNVAEWTSAKEFVDEFYDYEAAWMMVLRGCSWYQKRPFTRINTRMMSPLDDVSDSHGFRVLRWEAVS